MLMQMFPILKPSKTFVYPKAQLHSQNLNNKSCWLLPLAFISSVQMML